MPYLMLEEKIEKGDVWVEEYEVPDAFDLDALSGISLRNQQGSRRLYQKAKTSRKRDYLTGVFSFKVVSARFKAILEQTSDPLEFIPVELIHRKSNSIDKSYFIFNPLDNVACFDWKRSEFEEKSPTGMPWGVTLLAIDEKPLGGRALVRMEELDVILVSPALQHEITSQELDGLQLKPVAEFSEFP